MFPRFPRSESLSPSEVTGILVSPELIAEFDECLHMSEALLREKLMDMGPENFQDHIRVAKKHSLYDSYRRWVVVELIGEALEDCAWDIEDEEGDQLEDLVNWYSFLKSGKDCEEKASLSFSCCVGIRDSET